MSNKDKRIDGRLFCFTLAVFFADWLGSPFGFCIWGQFASTIPVGLYSEGRLNGAFFGYEFGGLISRVYIWRRVYMEGLISGTLRCLIEKYLPGYQEKKFVK